MLEDKVILCAFFFLMGGDGCFMNCGEVWLLHWLRKEKVKMKTHGEDITQYPNFAFSLCII